MRHQPPIPFMTRIKRAALGFDAWLNSSLFQGGRGLAGAWGWLFGQAEGLALSRRLSAVSSI